jgi:hypothetical protein
VLDEVGLRSVHPPLASDRWQRLGDVHCVSCARQ